MDSPEKPAIVLALETELAVLKNRITLCEDAIKEVIECYQNLQKERS